jgi:hypothetical protein
MLEFSSKSNFMKFRPVGDELLHADGMKLIAALRSFANAPKTHSVNVVQGNNLF